MLVPSVVFCNKLLKDNSGSCSPLNNTEQDPLHKPTYYTANSLKYGPIPRPVSESCWHVLSLPDSMMMAASSGLRPWGQICHSGVYVLQGPLDTHHSPGPPPTPSLPAETASRISPAQLTALLVCVVYYPYGGS